MYEMKRQITYSQVASDLKMDMAGLAHFFQDCTLFHSETIGKGLEEVQRSCTAWFLSGWQIEAERYPGFKEQITVRTWPYDFKGIYGYRNFAISDGKGEYVARANSLWFFYDTRNQNPARIQEADIRGYGGPEPRLVMD